MEVAILRKIVAKNMLEAIENKICNVFYVFALA